MYCPSCGAAIADGMAVCDYCQRPLPTMPAVPPQAARPPQPMPPHYRLLQNEGEDWVEIRWRWFSPAVFFLIPFCLAWNAFLIGWYSTALGDRGPGGAFAWLMIVFPAAHVAVGLGLIYAVLTMLVNATVLRVARGTLSVSHGPIYFPGLSPIETDAITQLFCVVSHRGESESATSYELRALLRDGRTLTILRHVTDRDEVLFLEQCLEAKLGLRDEPVGGELPR